MSSLPIAMFCIISYKTLVSVCCLKYTARYMLASCLPVGAVDQGSNDSDSPACCQGADTS